VLLPVAQIGLGLHSRAAVLWGRGAPSAFQHLFAISLHIFLGSAPASFVLVEILRF
jgi:hypothetical protein